MRGRSEVSPSLFLHFGGDLLDTEGALLLWCKVILLQGPMSRGRLVESFRDPGCVPYPLEVEPPELGPVVARGIESGDLEELTSGEIALSTECRLDILRRQEAARIDEEHSREGFLARALADFPTLPKSVQDELWQGLKDYSLRLMVGYVNGLENPESSLERADALVSEVFREDHPLHSVASASYPAFLRDTEAGKSVLAGALSHVIYAVRTSISDEAAEEVRTRLKHLHLYLDTNVLFSVLGMRGEPDQEEGVRRVLKMARDAGFSLHYTKQTREEFENALRRFRDRFDPTGGHDQAPDYVLRRARPSIDRAFFLQRSRSERNLDEFYDHFQDLNARLREYADLGITEAYLSEGEVERVRSGAAYDAVNDELLAMMQGEYTARQREHDAFEIALVDDERDGRDAISEVPSWFLTLHKQLTLVNERLGRGIPLVLTLDAWVMYFRPLLPRVEDFSEFFISIVSSNVFFGMDLAERELALAYRYLSGDVNRTAGDVIRRRFRSAPVRQLRPALDNSADAEELVVRLERMERAREQRLAEYAREMTENEAERLQAVVEDQARQLEHVQQDRIRDVESQARAERQLRQLSQLQTRRDDLDELNRAMESCSAEKASLEEAVRQIDGQRRSLRITLLVFIAVLYGSFLSILAAWHPDALGDVGKVRQALGFPLVPVAGMGAISWWLASLAWKRKERALRTKLKTVEENRIEITSKRAALTGVIDRLRSDLEIN